MTNEQEQDCNSRAASRVLHPLHVMLKELGLVTLFHASTDTKILILQRFIRLFAYGGSTLLLASYLSDLGIADARIGLFMTLTLVGDVFISFLLTLVADQLGRRWILVLGAALMSVAGVVFGLSGNYWVLLAGAIIGVISPRYVSRQHSWRTARLIGYQWQRNRTVSGDRGVNTCTPYSQRGPERYLCLVFSDRDCWHCPRLYQLRMDHHFLARREAFRFDPSIQGHILHVYDHRTGQALSSSSIEQGMRSECSAKSCKPKRDLTAYRR